MFDLSMPYDNDHPLFRLEIRRIRWGQSPRHLRRYSLWTLAIVGLIMLVLLVSQIVSFPRMYRSYAYWILAIFSNISVPLIFVSTLANLILDMVCILFTLTCIDSHHRKVWWELLRLTSPGLQGAIAAKHAVAQIRSWRVMIIAIGTRVVLGLIVVLSVLLGWSGAEAWTNVKILLTSLTLVVFFGTYILEPLWRMRALTALGLRVSSRVGNVALAGLTGFGALIVVWISETIMLGISYLVMALMSRIAFEVNSFFIDVGVSFMAFGISTLVIYNYYRTIRDDSLKCTLRNVLHE